MSHPNAEDRAPIIYNQSGIIVVNKPSGLPSQGTRKGDIDLHSLLKERFDYVGLHHRLDTPASGLLLLTTDRRWNKAIAEAFRRKSIQRSYFLALLGDTGPAGSWNWNLDGKKACTNWNRLKYSGQVSFVEAQLETGRTHQIRRHAVKAGFPVLGDRRYGGAAGKLWPRLALHAQKLVFHHPANQKTVEVMSPLPADLLEIEDSF